MAYPLPQRPPSTLLNMRNMTGDEAFAARCAMGSAHYALQSPPPSIKEEDNTELHITGMGLSRHAQLSNVKPEPLEDGEIKDGHAGQLISTIVQSQRRQSLEWNSNPTFPTNSSTRSSTRTPLPVRSPQTTLAMQTRSQTSQLTVFNNNGFLVGLDPQDRLDQRIFIRPRFKASQEIQLMLSQQWRQKGDRGLIPEAIRRITHQFMVANGFVASREHLPKPLRKKLWRSLLLRLDMVTDEIGLNTSSEQSSRLKDASSKLGSYIARQSVVWHDMGILIQWPTQAPPQFHPCTQRWISQSWNGQVVKDNTPQIDDLVTAITNLDYEELVYIQERIGVALKREGSKLYNPNRSSFCPFAAADEEDRDAQVMEEKGSYGIVKGEDSGYGS